MLAEPVAVTLIVTEALDALGVVLGVLKVQGNRLDRDYLRRMAADLGVDDLLERAFEEAG